MEFVDMSISPEAQACFAEKLRYSPTNAKAELSEEAAADVAYGEEGVSGLIRFDPVYFVHFKCNLKMIRQYDALNAYLQRIYEMPEVKPTVNFDHIKQHYYYSHKHINPYRIVPQGPRDLVAN